MSAKDELDPNVANKKQEAKIILNPKKPSVEETIPKLCDKVKEIDSLNLIIFQV